MTLFVWCREAHKMTLNKTYRISIGDRVIGGGAPVLIQSMCNTKTERVQDTVNQILRLEEAGCELIRVAIPTMEAATAITGIKKQIHIPIIGDIHFDYRLAIAAIENGVDKIRLNPGNIKERSHIEKVISLAKEREIPIRVGVNAGSLDQEMLEKYGAVTPEAMVESAMSHVRLLEDMNFDQMVISLKSSDVLLNNRAFELLAKKTMYPLHIGLTETGTKQQGMIKSAVSLGSLLYQGIGDTIRVSLTADPIHEVTVAKDILSALNNRRFGVNIISCPTCGRTEVDLEKMVARVAEATKNIKVPLDVAVMGCIVNGPGEAKQADLGIAGGKGSYLLFRKGIIIRRVSEAKAFDALVEEINQIIDEKNYQVKE